jgi:hypothetical protein
MASATTDADDGAGYLEQQPSGNALAASRLHHAGTPAWRALNMARSACYG